MKEVFHAYIDEAGDEGFGKLRSPGSSGQSRWLCLGAAVVRKENDVLLPAWRNEICEQLPSKRKKELHFRELQHEQKILACDFLSKKRLGICVIASKKETILDSPKKEVFKQKGHLYNYLVRFLLERVTSACSNFSERSGRNGAELHVTFSRRSGTDYQSMKEYLTLMRDGKEIIRPIRSINWSVLSPDNISVENHSKRAGLQIADVVTSATYAALEPNYYGYTEPRYSLLLKNRYLTDSHGTLNCGLTLIPKLHQCGLNADQTAFINDLTKK